MRPHSSGGERGRESELQCGAFRLLNSGGFHQRPEVPVDRPLLGVDGLGNATQKHCRSGDVLVSPSKLWGIVPLVHDVALNLAGMTQAPLTGLHACGTTCCTEYTSAGGGWFYHHCSSRASDRAPARGSGGV